jgi:hypothetical protein
MDASSIASPSPSTSLDRLKASFQRSLERSGPNSLYSRLLKAEITRQEMALQLRPIRETEQWIARMVR